MSVSMLRRSSTKQDRYSIEGGIRAQAGNLTEIDNWSNTVHITVDSALLLMFPCEIDASLVLPAAGIVQFSFVGSYHLPDPSSSVTKLPHIKHSCSGIPPIKFTNNTINLDALFMEYANAYRHRERPATSALFTLSLDGPIGPNTALCIALLFSLQALKAQWAPV